MTIPRLPGFRDRRSALGISILLFALVVWAFFPSTSSGFIGADDELFVTGNAQVQRGLTWESVTWALHKPVAANWHPLTTLSHMLDCQVYGLRPWGHHLTNVLLHAASTVLLFVVFRRMTAALWRPAVLAALFGLHPLRVESVAWVAERKDVLSTLFWMLTMLMYTPYAQGRRKNAECRMQNPESRFTRHASRYYLLSLLFFTLGLMSKPMVVTLPFVLLLLDYWPLGRNAECGMRSTLRSRPSAVVRRRTGATADGNAEPGAGGIAPGWTLPWMKLVWEKLPFFTLSAVASVITLLVQRTAGAVDTDMPLGARLANALVSYVRYLGKMFWPENLSVFYPHPRDWPAWQVMVSAGLLLAIFVTVIVLMRRRPYLGVGWLWFCGTLVPVIGLVQVGSQSMADRYSYVPSIGLLVALVWGVHELFARWRYRTVAPALLAGAATFLCLALTRRQLGWWKDDETLCLHALHVTKNNGLANYKLGVDCFNLAVTLAERGEFDEAIRYYEKAIQLSPGKDDAHRSLAYALLKTGQVAEAIREYELSLRLNPKDAEAHNNLGHILARQGRETEAVEHLTEALHLKPNYPEAHDNLGAVLAGRGRYAEAAAQFREVLRLKPDDPNARQKLERALAARQKLEQAAEPYRQTLRSNPGDVRALSNLGRLLLEAGQVDEAVEQCAEAARLDPKNAEIQYHLGAALAQKGEAEKAAHQFELALELDTGLAPAHYALGIVCEQQGRMPEAHKHWREAARLAPQWADPLNNLAWALATDAQPERRDGVEAVKLATRAVELAGTNHVRVLDTLAAAYAEAGRFAEAVATARQAQAEAEAQRQAELAEQIRQRLMLYQSHQPYRAPKL